MTSDPERPRILVVENDPHLRGALTAATDAAGAKAVGAATRRLAREELIGRPYAGMILSASLPDGPGLDLLEELRKRQFHLHVLVISGALSAAVANHAHRLGASCVFAPDLAPNVRAFVHRAVGATAEATRRTMAAAHEVAIAFGFTPREREIVELVALGVSRDRLAVELGVSENTLKTLVRRALGKCKEKSLEGLARLVLDEVVALSCRTEPI